MNVHQQPHAINPAWQKSSALEASVVLSAHTMAIADELVAGNRVHWNAAPDYSVQADPASSLPLGADVKVHACSYTYDMQLCLFTD